ncbi:MAG: RpiB/LacA/LacB family sugar-phosphate isomerase [bacterium]|nr:RpiB/LacA/LacB family sugar-phosphate isomerase [bacterium]
MKVFFAADHGGFALKEKLVPFVQELGYDVEDCGAHELNMADDYPDFVQKAALAVSADPQNVCAIILGASGQGEAMAANRFPGVRAAVFYGEPPVKQTDAAGKELTMLESTRAHNHANVLSLGARFLSEDKAKEAVREWLAAPRDNDERHMRRVQKIDNRG